MVKTLREADSAPVTPITFSATDRFCLNGERLVTGGTYGRVAGEYRTERDALAKVVSVGGTTGSPDSWVVKTKTGLTMYYGASNASRYHQGNPSNGRVISWLLEKTVDTVGNIIAYSWYLPNSGGNYFGGYYLTTISYGGNEILATPHQVRIVFNYTQVTSGFYPSGALYGQKLGWNFLLRSIHSEIAGNILRTWTVSYSSLGSGPTQRQSPLGSRSALA